MATASNLQENSVFWLYRKPEQVRDLEITASVMRAIQGVSEGAVNEASSLSDQALYEHDDLPLSAFDKTSSGILTRALLEKGMWVPPSKNDKPGKPGSVVTLVPLTPRVARFATFTRKKGNPWNPGAYVQGMLLRGSRTNDYADETWQSLAEAFHVEPSSLGSKKDAYAILVEKLLLEVLSDGGWDGSAEPLKATKGWAEYPGEWVEKIAFPARSLASDLRTISRLEPLVTRRTWIGILDCFLRLAISADMLWVAHLNRGLVSLLERAASGELGDSIERLDPSPLMPSFSPLKLGAHLENSLKEEVREFAKARVFIEEYLGLLSEADIQSINDQGGISSEHGLVTLLNIAIAKGEKVARDASKARNKVFSENPDMMSFKGRKTWTHQLYFALRYGLGQRSTTEENRHFDQGYWAKKSGIAKNAPWRVELGPVGLLLMVYLATEGQHFATARDLREKLMEYGITVSIAELSSGHVGTSLRNLGLVTDSPDAESGMVLRNPFPG